MDLMNFFFNQKMIEFSYFCHQLDFKHVHAFLFLNLKTPFILLDKEKVHLYYVGLPFW